MWYALPMATFPGAQILRWRLRGLLKLLPTRASPRSMRRVSESRGKGALRIAYLFTGTYGDFVQALRPLNRLASAYPGCDLVLVGAERYAREFGSELPAGLRTPGPFEPWAWVFRRRHMIFTNAVGVYRVRSEFMGRFCARLAFGFRHVQEKRRGGYDASLALGPSVRSFADENLKLLDLAGVPESAVPAGQNPAEALSGPRDETRFLFHVGSAGLKNDFGLKVYTRVVFGILGRLEGRAVDVVIGPGDEDIALEVSTGTGFVPQMFPLSRLISNLRNFQGTVICFNSFLAHLCVYLGRSAIVIHRQAVPFGYDCGPLHRQVVLTQEKDWDLAEVWDALGL